MNIRTNSDGSISITNDSGKVLIGLSLDGQISINAPSNDVHLGDSGTKDVILLPEGTVFTKFTAADPQNWQGSPPVYEWDAINRLASACAALGHKP